MGKTNKKELLSGMDIVNLASMSVIAERVNELIDIIEKQNEINILVRKNWDKMDKRIKKLENERQSNNKKK